MGIKFTGDRTTDRIMNIWYDWYSDEYNCNGTIDDLSGKELDKLMYEIGMEDFVSYVLEEFPQMENVGYTYDAEDTWDMFLRNTKVGDDVNDALEEFLGSYVIDNSYVDEYIDKDWISETYDEGDLELFFTKNPIGKKMYVKDKKALIEAFVDGISKFENGYGFGIDEYAEVVMCDGDDEGHVLADIHDYMTMNSSNSKYWIVEGFVYNPRLYNGKDIHCVVRVNLEEIAKHADLKK